MQGDEGAAGWARRSWCKQSGCQVASPAGAAVQGAGPSVPLQAGRQHAGRTWRGLGTRPSCSQCCAMISARSLFSVRRWMERSSLQGQEAGQGGGASWAGSRSAGCTAAGCWRAWLRAPQCPRVRQLAQPPQYDIRQPTCRWHTGRPQPAQGTAAAAARAAQPLQAGRGSAPARSGTRAGGQFLRRCVPASLSAAPDTSTRAPSAGASPLQACQHRRPAGPASPVCLHK